ncbi:MAG: hypothetical protein R8K50_04980, partial [Mariprofundus sp.]
GWQPESPTLRVRKALLGSDSGSNQMLSGHGRLLYVLRNTHAVTVDLLLSQQHLSPLLPLPLHSFYQLDDNAPVAVTLAAARPQHHLSLRVPAGDHLLRVGMQDAVANQFLQAQLRETGKAVPITIIERPWYVATAAEPVRVAVAGPAWLRIDQWREGRIQSRYQWVAGDFEQLQLSPAESESEALFRVAQRIVIEGAAVILPRTIAVKTEPVAPPYVRIELAGAPSLLSIEDGFQLGGQEDGTWSYAAQLARRRDTQGVSNTQAENFLQLSATHRYFDEERRSYFRSELLARSRSRGGPTLGLKESIEYNPIWSTVNINLDAALYGQHIRSGSVASGNGWSAYLKGSLSQKRDIDPKSYHVPRLSLFGRYLSLQAPANGVPGLVDQDIYTRYKATHRYGLTLADNYYYRPWLDTLWKAGGSLMSNQDFNIIRADHIAIKAGWQQLLGSVQLGVNYQMNHYFSDNLRQRSANQRTWLLDASWHQWGDQQDRLELGLQLRHDSDTGNITGMLNLIWHDSNGRGYRDFSPGEVDFRDLRNRDMPTTVNNRIQEINHD